MNRPRICLIYSQSLWVKKGKYDVTNLQINIFIIADTEARDLYLLAAR